MSPRTLARATIREAPLLRADQAVGEAVETIVEARLPALPVVKEDGTLLGIFGEREFIEALFPGYLGELQSAAFVPGSIDDVIDRRLGCRKQPVSKYANTEHIEAGPGHSDTQLAETFLHHRVLIIPIVEAGTVTGIITRWDFFTALVERLSERS
jgi:CBS domain-containing protein